MGEAFQRQIWHPHWNLPVKRVEDSRQPERTLPALEMKISSRVGLQEEEVVVDGEIWS
jgi:hypothetical protein